MADVVSASSFGYCIGALSRWAVGIEDPLVTAIGDFPKRGILVCFELSLCDLQLIVHIAKCCPGLGLEISMFHPQPPLASALRLRQDHERGKQQL